MRRASIFVATIALVSALSAPLVAAEPKVKLLDDFEGGSINWTGTYRGSIVAEYATHGRMAFKVTFERGVEYPGITASKIDLDWAGYDALKLDIYNPQPTPVQMAIRIDDDRYAATYSSRYNGEFLLVNGQTRLEIPFEKMTVSGQPLHVDKVKTFMIFMASPDKDTVLYFDNVRVAAGKEGPETIGRTFASGEATPEVKAARERAVAARSKLAAMIDVANRRGVGTLEANIALITAGLGIDVRPNLAWYAGRKGELYEYVSASCDAASDGLKDIIEGRRAATPVPPVYSPAELEFAGPDLVEKHPLGPRSSVLLFSMLYHDKGPLCEYFTPISYDFHSNAFAGASRYDVERTPLWKAYHEFPDTHRVWNGDEGWCGHIVRDPASMGGGSEPVVVCLESPHTRAAIEEYLKSNASRWQDNPNLLVNVMGGELSYICYCPYTLDMFRACLKKAHGSIEGLNAAWGTDYKSFDDVKVMPSAAQSGENRARWYDWQAFNCRRFVDHAEWSKSLLRDIKPDVKVAVGAVSYSLRSHLGNSGVDEENLVRRVDDVVLNECGPSTITTDLLYSLSEGAKPMFDFEYHGDVANILPNFLHGNTALAMWWWPDKPDTEFPQFNETALPFSWNIPLADVAEALKIGLDVRRLAPEIAAFPKAKAEMAVLYSRASMLQVPPEFASGTDTPYTMELKNVYSSMLGLDAPVRFVSSTQAEEGKLAGYRLLVVPGATYVTDGEAEAALKFASDGGTLVVTPNSLMFDPYARPKDYLARLGIKVKSMRSPVFGATGVKRDAFLQGMIRETTADGVPRETLTVAKDAPLAEGTTLSGAGVFQTIEAPDKAKVIATAADASPAILEIHFGAGTVYYLAMPLVPESMNALLDAVAPPAGVTRPMRSTVAARHDWRIEARAVPYGDLMLFYVVNRSGARAGVSVSLPEGFTAVTDLRDPWREVRASSITVEAGRTGIYAARKEKAENANETR